MSKLTIEEAISHCLEVAEKNETQAEKIGRQFIGSAMDKSATDYRKCAAEQRQLAEWLTELKHLKAIIAGYGTVDMQKLDMILAMIRTKSESVWTGIERERELAEAKRLLKLAVEDMSVTAAEVYNGGLICECCKWKSQIGGCCCPDDGGCDVAYRWRYADEALKLIGESNV